MAGDGDEERIVLVSDALQARLDAVCDGARDPASVTLAAIEHFRAELPALVRDARVRLASPVADGGVRHLGVGPVRVRLRPGAAGARLLDRLSDELGVPWRTWVPAVLNAYLPGRREPEDMPWIAPEHRPGPDARTPTDPDGSIGVGADGWRRIRDSNP